MGNILFRSNSALNKTRFYLGIVITSSSTLSIFGNYLISKTFASIGIFLTVFFPPPQHALPILKISDSLKDAIKW